MNSNGKSIWESLQPLEREYEEDEFILSPLARDTERGWRHILKLCEREIACGFGALDSFLTGPDLERRMSLVEKEALVNLGLKSELCDTIQLNQSKDWSPEQILRMQKAAGLKTE